MRLHASGLSETHTHLWLVCGSSRMEDYTAGRCTRSGLILYTKLTSDSRKVQISSALHPIELNIAQRQTYIQCPALVSMATY